MGVLIVRQAGHLSNSQIAQMVYGDDQSSLSGSPLVFVEPLHGGPQALYNAVSRTVTAGFIDEIHFWCVNLTGLVPFHGSRRAIEALGDYFRHDTATDANFPVVIRFTGCTPANPSDSQIRLLGIFWRLACIVVKIDQRGGQLLHIPRNHSRSRHALP